MVHKSIIKNILTIAVYSNHFIESQFRQFIHEQILLILNVL